MHNIESITLYSTPGCMQCALTQKAFDKAGIHYDVVDVSSNPFALEYITSDLGYTQAPVVVLNDDEHWSGFRPDLIDALAQPSRTNSGQ